MNPLSRRRFLVLTGAGVVAVAAGGIALTVRQLSGSGRKTMLSFQAMTGLPGKPFLSYASYVIIGNVNVSNGTGSITTCVYAGPPENTTSISLLTRVVRVTGVRQQGSTWHISGVVDNQAQLQRGEDATLALQLDSSSDIAQSTFFGSPIQLKLQKFATS
jgi:hypothetical protein